MVAIQEEQTKEWTRRGKIVREVAPRSYEVAVENGHILRRNQRYLRQVYVYLTVDNHLLESDGTRPSHTEKNRMGTIPSHTVRSAIANKSQTIVQGMEDSGERKRQ